MSADDPTLAGDSEPTLVRCSPSPQSSSELFDGRYRIISPLGAGGFGEVLLVEDTLQANARLALKRIHTPLLLTHDAQAQFRTEIEALRTLRTDAIVQIYNDGRTPQGECYFTMEYVEGPTLERELRTRARLGVEHATALLIDLTSALEYAHSRSIVHRDLKPANVILGRNSDGSARTVVLDFGIAKLLGDSSEPTGLVTRMGIGTPHYMSPEQRLGTPVDTRSDLFALGALMYRVIAGSPPDVEDGGTPGRDRVRTLLEFGAPRELARVIDALLDCEPAARPSLSAVRATAQRTLRATRRTTRLRSRRVGAALVAGLALAGLLAAWALLDRESRSRTALAGALQDVELRADPAPPRDGEAVDSRFAPQFENLSPSQLDARSNAEVELATVGLEAGATGLASRRSPASPPGSAAGEGQLAFDPLRLPDGFEPKPDTRLHGGEHQVLVHERLGIKLVRLPIGRARLGPTSHDCDARPDEGGRRDFDLQQPAYLSSCEITRRQFSRYCQATGQSMPRHDPRHSPVDEEAVVDVSWLDAAAFAAWLGLELPSEALWEYAALAGATTRFSWGDSPAPPGGAALENLCDHSAVARLPTLRGREFDFDDHHPAVAPVGSFAANAFGLFDMVGNVSEWCANSYGTTPNNDLQAELVPDIASHRESERVVRGASWSSHQSDARPCSRRAMRADAAHGHIGFRVAWIP